MANNGTMKRISRLDICLPYQRANRGVHHTESERANDGDEDDGTDDVTHDIPPFGYAVARCRVSRVGGAPPFVSRFSLAYGQYNGKVCRKYDFSVTKVCHFCVISTSGEHIGFACVAYLCTLGATG
jgi:hypothetical protein